MVKPDMAKSRPTPSWTQQSNQPSQRAHVRANARSRTLRRDPTPSEARLWKALRALNREAARFRRQPAVGPWVFDFADHSARLLIEVDGGVHERLPGVAARDARKSAWAEAQGYRLLRFSNDDVWGRLDAVISLVRSAISDPHPLPSTLRVDPHKGEGR